MTDLSKGIIDINGFTIKPGTTLKKMQDFFGDKVRVLELSAGPRLKLRQPYYLSENIYAYNFDFDKNGVIKKLALVPNVPDELKGNPTAVAKYMLQTSMQWLKGMIEETPSSESNESISYTFNGGYIRSATRNDIHYGLVGGEIVIYYEV